MTREEASIIIGNIPINGDECYSISEYQQAKAMAIEALEQVNKINKIACVKSTNDLKGLNWEETILGLLKTVMGREACEDCISRQAVNDLVDELARAISDERCYMSRGRSTATIMQDILDLPSVTPKEKTGHWFVDERPESDREVICSNCEQPVFKYHKLEFDYRPKFCPNCGARMIESQESEDKEE